MNIYEASAGFNVKHGKVQRAIHQGIDGLCPEAVARVEGVHPTTVQRWVGRACIQAKAADC